MGSENLNRRRRKIWIWGGAAFCVLIILCLWSHSRSIPRDIEARARETSTLGGFNSDLLSAVDGRTVILAGEIEGGVDRNKLVALLKSVRGVRSVSDNLKLTKPGDARLILESSGSEILLRGVIPDDAAVEKTVAAAIRAYGAENVTNQLTVGSDLASAEWIDGLAELVPALVDLADARVVAGGERVFIGGTLNAAEKGSLLLAKAKELLANLPVDNQIQVRAPARASPPVRAPLESSPEFPPLYFEHDSTDLVEASQRLLNEVIDLRRT